MIPHHRLALLAGLVVVPVLGGCGSGSDSDSDSDRFKVTTVVRTVTTPPTVKTTTSPTHTTTEPQVTPTEPAGRTVHAGFFRSPSGNIGCVMAGGTARCDIRDRAWSPPPRPASCPLDYGQGVIVSRSGRGRFVCAGDTALNPDGPPLAYDTASQVGSLTCFSRENGMRCTNEDEHGFFLNRSRAELF